MGVNIKIRCPKDGCDYVGGFRLGMGEEEDSTAYAERVSILRKEHPSHPTPVTTNG